MTRSVPETDYIYDIETYLDLFCADITHAATGHRWIFEVSDRRNQSPQFISFIYHLRHIGARMFGFNNEGFDWVVIQSLLDRGDGHFTALDAHHKANLIIRSQDRFGQMVWPSDRTVTQGDLYKIHHFDNAARSTGLKKLEINMRSHSVEDLPYPPDQPTTSAQKDEIIAYMCHDVSETLRFYYASLDQIRFRDDLAEKYPDLGDVLNFNDTKIGKKFFERELERNGTPCYTRDGGRRRPLQTLRHQIALRDVISPRVTFQHPEFQRVKQWLEAQILTRDQVDDALIEAVNTKGVFKNLSAVVDGFGFDFGTGGIHGSLHDMTIREDNEWEIWDWDVASYYPNLAIANRFYPAHLSESFCTIYEQVYEMRRQYPKGTAENAMLKLALNGVYGDSNNKYSPFYDPQYTMSITVNGQLMLCMLAEWLTQDYIRNDDSFVWKGGPHGTVKMIQVNTDGLTVKVHRDAVDWMKRVCAAWERHTGLTLESVRYRSMHIRDVNSYLAVKHDGGVKRIGAYAYETPLNSTSFQTKERGWYQDHSMLVVRKAAEAHMVYGIPVADFIMNHDDPFDFMLSIKVPRTSRLMHGDTRAQNTSRYYVSTDGAPLTKVMPPLKGKHDDREIGVQTGWTVTLTNNADDFRWDNVNWLYYITEAEKLIVSNDTM